MRNIAIIGSGQAGLLAAHALLKAGYRVTLYSDRSPEQWLHESRPTGTAARFELSLRLEDELELNPWAGDVPWGEGLHITFCPKPGNRLLTLTGRLRGRCAAIDLRLQSHHWLRALEARGGKVELESVSVPRLEDISAGHELTLVAAGRAELCRLFARDAARSVYDKPQRHLSMVCVKGPALGFDGIPLLPVKINLLATAGESFWVPYFHKDAGASWNLLFEARPGGPMDRFQRARSASEVLEVGKRLIRELLPWDYPWVKDAEVSDANGWTVGSFAPTVREPVGRLPSGRLVMALGDTAMSLDPIGGQGANNGNKMARNLVECIVAHQDRPFDEAWMTDTFERFYQRHGHATSTFNNLLLEPITPAARELLIAQYGSDGRPGSQSACQLLANAFAENFNDPSLLTPLMLDPRGMRQFIERTTGQSWMRALAVGGLGVAREGLRQWRGQEPRHPRVPGPRAGTPHEAS